MFQFGSGNLWAIPTISLAGTTVTLPTPVPFGALQDVSVDISFSSKQLYGQYQFPLAVGRGTAKITGKAKAARITASLFNQVFGETLTNPGENKVAFQEAGTVPGSPSYTITVTNSATWTVDLGVSYAATGAALTRVAQVVAAGQYSVAAGVYTFHSGDANAAVKISYIYAPTTTGAKFTINNQLLGLCPFFSVTLNQNYQGKHLTVTFNRAMANKLTFSTKLEDFLIPELDMEMMADDSNVVGSVSMYDAN